MGKIVVMFPGQGAQKVGMLRELHEQYSEMRHTFDEAEQILGQNIRGLMWDGPQDELDLTRNTQPVMLTAEVAIFRILQREGVEPDVLTGFSLGEWAAAVAAEMIPFDRALRLVCIRAEAMQKAVPFGCGGMAAIIGLGKDEVTRLCASCKGYVIPANYNYPGQITVSGSAEAIRELEAHAEKEKFAFQVLSVSIPSHCDLMMPAAERLKNELRDVQFHDARWPILLNVNNRMIVSGEEMKRNLVEQLTKAICFEQSISMLLESGADTFVEAGPGKTLAGFVRKTAKRKKVPIFSNRVDTKEELEEVLNQLRR